MKVKGYVRIPSDSVEISPLEVVNALYESEISKYIFSNLCPRPYSSKHFQVLKDHESNSFKIEEVYIESGYSHGHYEKDDTVIHRQDRTLDFNQKVLEYLWSLQVVSSHLKYSKYSESV